MSNGTYQVVTDQICELLSKGVIPWRRAWSVDGSNVPMNITGRQYHGVNRLLLSLSAMQYSSNVFGTMRQINQAGGRVRKGERGFPVYYFSVIEKRDPDHHGEIKKIPIFRYSRVWNVDQCDDVKIPARLLPAAPTSASLLVPIESAETVVANYKEPPKIVRSDVSERAFYDVGKDTIVVPSLIKFDDVNEFYSTLFHEMGHSTGHASRLNRREIVNGNKFASHDYGIEELTAEMTSAFLCADCGIDNTLANSAAYISNWLTAIKADNKLVMAAASRAQKAADLIHGILNPAVVAD